jgi:methionine-rich copper-binding protein CopC
MPVTTILVASGLLAAVPPAMTPAQAASCANPIVCENQQPGTPKSVWDVNANTDDMYIQGFADPFSVNVGGSINFKIESAASSYTIDIYRMGYYGGDGARLVASITNPNISASQNQPVCNTVVTTGLIDCGNWSVSATWSVPITAVSGVYFAQIYTANRTHENQIPFVVTNNASTSNIVFMTNDSTWQAYNDWGQRTPTSTDPGGGNSLYQGNSTGSPWCCTQLDPERAVEVSYNRPFATRYVGSGGQDFFFSMEFPMIQWMEENGYDVSYVSNAGVDADTSGQMLSQHKTFMTVGHSEYWSAGMRTAVTDARNNGTSLAFFAGNLMQWKIRFAADPYNNEADRTIICYKESLDSARTDPNDPPTWTGTWTDPRFSPPADGGQPPNAITGQNWAVNSGTYAVQVPSTYSALRFWRDTSIASLPSGQSATLSAESLGYEWDLDMDNGFRPPGEIDMSSTTETPPQVNLTYSEQLGSIPVTNHLTLYRASSGALVFDTGSVQWSWGLNSNHDGDQVATNTTMQQATVNLFADMGAAPGSPVSGLTYAPEPADTTAPTSTITSPSAGATLANGSTVTISGTATDSGGGVVAGVEVSTDGGSTWHPVTTMSAASTSVTWSYTWSAAGSGSVTIKSRATNDSGYIESPGSGVTVTVNCPCSIFGSSYTPSTTSTSDSNSYELGMKFQSSVSGWVAGVRFYKGSGNGGTHTGSLWTAGGTLLATGTFTNETANGWQSMSFTNAIPISANTTYVVSYWDPSGHYANETELFDYPMSTPPLTAVKSDYVDAGGGNGVFDAGGQGFPTQQFDGASYAVDVIFDTTQPKGPPPSVTTATPVAGSSSNPVSTDPSLTFSEAVVPSSASFTLKNASGSTVSGSASFDSTDTVYTFTPSSALAAGTSYTATISGIVDKFGQTMATYTYTFTTSKAFDSGGQCPCAIWPDVTPSSVSDAADTSSIEVGVQFRATQNGTISGIRFYKEPDNTGAHTGTLWTASGTQLATGTFSSESTQGWEEVDFSSPVSITAGTTYVASYHTTTGHYADTSGGLSSAVTNGPLTALASGGVYAYSASTTFPSSTFQASNYWVDVVYTPASVALAVSSTTPIPGSSSNPVSTDPSVTFSEAVVPSSASFTLKDASGSTVSGSASFDSTDTVYTFTPSSALAAGITYTATISGIQTSTGQTIPTYTYTFTTSKAFDSGGQCPCAIWPDVTPSSVSDAADTSSIEVGVQFRATQNGTISGIRFYKEPDNTGTHTGTLWTASGTELATGTFTNESTAGWQELDFSNPVSITVGTTYVASYHTTTGHYAATSGGLSSAVTNGPLTALAGGGVYAYSSSTTFPTNTFGNSNYWVDVVFQQNLNAPSVTATTPGSSATSVPVSSAVTATFNEAIKAGSATFSVTGPGGSAVSGTTTLNSSGTVLTFAPASALSPGAVYQASVSGATSTSGVAMTSPYNWSFTTSGPTACPCTIWESDATPATPSVNDSSAVELGVKFQVSTSGWIYGVRFYKGPGNTGTHTGSLWTDTGMLLAHGTFTNETASGWQTLEFPTAVPVSTGQTYVATYYAPNGGYASTGGYFASSAYNNAPLTALQNGTDGANGVYSYGGDQFPTSSFNSSNYWVDPIFWTSTPPNAPSCPCSIWPASAQPSVPSVSDTAPVNLGVKFTPEENGNITGIRFYKGSGNTGTHVGSLWTTSGALLGQVTFTSETASGWQQANFSSPIAVTAGTTYVASYFAPNGGYANDSGYFASSGVLNIPLYAPQSSAVSGGNGVYSYGSSPAFPSSTYNATNYWVDVVFHP